MEKIKYIMILITLVLLLGSNSFSKIVLSEQEANEIYNRLEQDEKIIKWQSTRWNNLVNTNPHITYEIEDGDIIIQTIEFSVKNDKPLIYEIKMKIIQENEPKTYFPLTLSLCGIIETAAQSHVDAKVGIQLFNFPSIGLKYFKSLGVHFLLGAQSSGISLSWKISKYFKNTRLHIYSGMSYEAKKSFGTGVSLNF